MTFHPFFHDMDPHEIECKKRLAIWFTQHFISDKRYEGCVSISCGSGFFEVYMLDELSPGFFKAFYIVEDPEMSDCERKQIRDNFLPRSVIYLNGSDGVLADILTNHARWLVIGINMNFYNEWDFRREFSECVSDRTDYFFVWCPYFHDTCHVITNRTDIDWNDFPFHVQIDHNIWKYPFFEG